MPKTSRPPLIKARDALKRVEAVVRSSPEAKRILAHKIRDREVSAYAFRIWKSRCSSLKDAWANEPSDAAKKMKVSSSLFVSNLYWADELHAWSWPAGKFWITHDRAPARRTMLRGVRFVEGDVDRLVESLKAHPGGRPSDRQKWDAYWMAVVEMAVDGSLVDTRFDRNAQGLNGEIFERAARYSKELHKEGTTLGVTRDKVWKALVLPRLEAKESGPGDFS